MFSWVTLYLRDVDCARLPLYRT